MAMELTWGVSKLSIDGFMVDKELGPKDLLNLARKKRRAVFESKVKDMRKRVLHTALVRNIRSHLKDKAAQKKKLCGTPV
uniref:60S ribosomal protein L36 n=1 Tax=Caenorhabditis tropicalis TaxID=1561998 RepID=A0A1I7U224_9PELO